MDLIIQGIDSIHMIFGFLQKFIDDVLKAISFICLSK